MRPAMTAPMTGPTPGAEAMMPVWVGVGIEVGGPFIEVA